MHVEREQQYNREKHSTKRKTQPTNLDLSSRFPRFHYGQYSMASTKGSKALTVKVTPIGGVLFNHEDPIQTIRPN